jgi:hypothetical protein
MHSSQPDHQDIPAFLREQPWSAQTPRPNTLPLLPSVRFAHEDAIAGEYVTALDERRHPRSDGPIGIGRRFVEHRCRFCGRLGSAAAPLPLLSASAPAVRIGLPLDNRVWWA